ncbi:digestive cysteine proteinase 1-like [Babylonia areolata]|uniref:digestive cysteine proteinase 1-like n=1 Tax=Babylonia areolata TaxID=304850 RepID=UPI003FD05CEA
MAPLQVAAFLMLLTPVVSKVETAQVRTNYTPYEDTWEEYKREFEKSYSSPEEENVHFRAFVDKVKDIEAHNRDFLAKRVSYSKGINQFTDDTTKRVESCHVDEDEGEDGHPDERHKRRAGFCRRYYPPPNSVPPDWDWVSRGVVTPVGNQGHCSSCYSFGVTTTIAAQVKLKTRRPLVPLSEQQLVDCHVGGCHKGSNAEEAFKYIRDAGGIMSARDYPYSQQNLIQRRPPREPCAFSRNRVVARVRGCLSSTGEDDLKKMVALIGPVYVSVAVVDSFFQVKDGVYSEPNCGRTNPAYRGRHCLTVVGYGTDRQSGKDYWVVKNSWGTRGWGQSHQPGFAWIERGRNTCGIGRRFTVPVVSTGRSRGCAIWRAFRRCG